MRAIAEVEFASPFDRGELLVASSVKFLLAHASETDHVFITHDHRLPAIDDRAYGELWLNRHANLAHQDQVVRRVEFGCDLRRDRHTAARQVQHDRPLSLVTCERLCELSAGVRAIDEWHHGLRELPGIDGTYETRCVLNHRAACSITILRVPGSGNRWVASGTISSLSLIHISEPTRPY